MYKYNDILLRMAGTRVRSTQKVKPKYKWTYETEMTVAGIEACKECHESYVLYEVCCVCDATIHCFDAEDTFFMNEHEDVCCSEECIKVYEKWYPKKED